MEYTREDYIRAIESCVGDDLNQCDNCPLRDSKHCDIDMLGAAAMLEDDVKQIKKLKDIIDDLINNINDLIGGTNYGRE